MLSMNESFQAFNAMIVNSSSSSNGGTATANSLKQSSGLTLEELNKKMIELVKLYDIMFHKISAVRKYNFPELNGQIEIVPTSLTFHQKQHLNQITGIIKGIYETLQDHHLRKFHGDNKLASTTIPSSSSLYEKNTDNISHLQQQIFLLKDYLLKEVAFTERKDVNIKALKAELKEKDNIIDALRKELSQLKPNSSALASLKGTETKLPTLPHNSLLITLEPSHRDSSPPTTQSTGDSSLSATEETTKQRQASVVSKIMTKDERKPLTGKLRRSLRKEIVTIDLANDDTEEESNDSDLQSIAEEASNEIGRPLANKPIDIPSNKTQMKSLSTPSSRLTPLPSKSSSPRSNSDDSLHSESSEEELQGFSKKSGKQQSNDLTLTKDKKLVSQLQLKPSSSKPSDRKESHPSRSSTPTSSVVSTQDRNQATATPSRKKRSSTFNSEIANSYAVRKKKKAGKPTISAATRASIERCKFITRKCLKLMLGRFVERLFEDGLYYGVVSRYRMPYFLIIYEDGDREELDYVDLQDVLVADEKVAKNRRNNCLNEAKKHGFLEDDIPLSPSLEGNARTEEDENSEDENSEPDLKEETMGESRAATKRYRFISSAKNRNQIQPNRSSKNRKRSRTGQRKRQNHDDDDGDESDDDTADTMSLESESELSERINDSDNETSQPNRQKILKNGKPRKRRKLASEESTSPIPANKLENEMTNGANEESMEKVESLTSTLIKSSVKTLSENTSMISRDRKYLWNSPTTNDAHIVSRKEQQEKGERKDANAPMSDSYIDLTQSRKNLVRRRSNPRGSTARSTRAFSFGESSESDREEDENRNETSNYNPSSHEETAEIILIPDTSSDDELMSVDEEEASDEVAFIIKPKSPLDFSLN